MATIGHHRAVAEIKGRKFSGWIAGLLWSVVHVLLLNGFRNRLAVTREWLGAYIKREGGSPLITDHHERESTTKTPAPIGAITQ